MNNTLIWCDAGFNSSDQYSWKQYFAEKFTNPNPVGSGPFVWAGRSGGRITLKAWEGHFYRPGSTYYTYNSGACAEPGIGTLALTEYLSEDRAIWDLENDLLDLIAWDQPSAITRFAGSEDVSYQCLEPTYFAQMAFNLRRRSFGYDRDYSSTIFTDTDYGKPLRKALAHCVDAASMNSLANLATSNPPLAFASWKNLSAPAYAYDPSAAMSILNNTGYRQSNPGSALGADNRWLNPDGTEIGSLPDGSIELLVPESSEDLIMYQAGEVLAGQMRAIGLRTELVQLNSTALAQRLESRDFDMCVVGHWITPAERKRPETFYYTMLHSDMAMYGPNFCGYGNSSLDTILAHAMAATDRARHMRYVQDCESTMDYDVPLYTIFRASATEFYRADNFEGFADGGSGTLLNALTLANLAKQEKAILRSRFIGVPITWQSNSTKPVLVKVTDQDGRAVQGADVTLACSAGTLLNLNGRTNVYGQFSTDFTAPYVPVTEEYTNTMTVRLSVTSAILVGYRPAIRADFAITVFPERLRTMSIRAFADPDTVTARDSFGNPGFTLVSVTVRDGANMPVDGALLRLRPGDGNITLSAEETRTDEGGQAEFRVYASDVAGIAECNITINATKGGFRNASQEVALTVLPYEPGDAESGATMLERLALPIIMAACSFAVAGTVHILRRRRRAG